MNSSARWSGRLKAIVFGFGIALSVQTSGNWFRILNDRVPDCGQPNCVADFVTFYAQAKLFWTEPQSLYNLDRQLAYQNAIAPTERVLPFVYPPITAALMAPLALLPFHAAFLFATIFNLGLILTSLRLLMRQLSLSADQSQWLLLFALCSFGAHAVVFYGQTSAVVLFCLTRHVLSRRRSRSDEAGVWAGMLSFKPQYLPIPHLALLLSGEWRGLLIGALLSTGLIVGTFFLAGIETTKQYFDLAHRMVNTDDDWWNRWRSMHNLRVLTIYWLPAAWQKYAWWTGVGLVLAALIGWNLRSRKNPAAFAIVWIVNLLGLLLVLPHLFTHDLTLLILPCALLLSLFKQTVPPLVGLGIIVVAALPALNYLLPTSTAFVLLALFLFSLFLAPRLKPYKNADQLFG